MGSGLVFQDGEGNNVAYRAPLNKEELRWQLRMLFGVDFPTVAQCPGHTAPFDALAEAYFARELGNMDGRVVTNSIWIASRGYGGKTHLLAYLTLMELLALYEVVLLGGSGEQSIRAHEETRGAWGYNAETYLCPSCGTLAFPKERVCRLCQKPLEGGDIVRVGAPTELLKGEALATKTSTIFGNKMQALPASSKSVRGPHPHRMRMDECLLVSSLVWTKRGKVRIGDILTTDSTLSLSGDGLVWRPVRKLLKKGVRHVVRVTLADGKELTCTPEHLLKTTTGWVAASDSIEREVYILPDAGEESRNTLSTVLEREHQSTGSRDDSMSILSAKDEDRFGGVLQVLDQVQAWSTDSTTTQMSGLRQPGIWRALSSMPRSVFGNNRCTNQNEHAKGSEVWNIESRVSCTGTLDRTWPVLESTCFCGSIYCRSGSRQLGDRGARRLLASERSSLGEAGASTSSPEGTWVHTHVPVGEQDAPLAFGITTSRVVSVVDAGEGEVYDIMLDDPHNFIAEGMVVHNCDEMDLKILDSALGQTIARSSDMPAQTVFASTHHYESGTMTELLKRAAKLDWPVRRWCFRDTMFKPENPGSWLLPEEIERKRREVNSNMWRTEYDLEPPKEHGSALFTQEQLNGLFTGPATEETLNRELCIEPPDADGEYVTSADWARKGDLSVITTFRTDNGPMRLVSLTRYFQQPWSAVISAFNERRSRYPGRGIHDATGLGDVIADQMEHRTHDYVITGANRNKLFLDLETGIDQGAIQLPQVEGLMEVFRQTQREDVYGTGHPPDEVVAVALAWQMAGNRLVNRKLGKVGRVRLV